MATPSSPAAPEPGPPIHVRLATPADATVIAYHRARMFDDMGELPASLFDRLCAAAETQLAAALARGEYVGWLACPEGKPDVIVAGAGVQLRRALPHPLERAGGEVIIAEGRHAIVLNVFTEPAWRRRGVAEVLMRRIVTWSLEQGLDRLVLHASAKGRRIYERLGFVATNEMRLADSGGFS